MKTLIVINFVLLLCTVFLAIILIKKYNQLADLEEKYELMQREFAGQMEAFLLEIKEENEKFIQEFQQTIEERDVHHPASDARTDHPPVVDGQENAEEADVSGPETREDTPEPSFNKYEKDFQQVADYLTKGFSVPEIAKALNRGKTEIELLIKFNPTLMNIYSKNVQN